MIKLSFVMLASLFVAIPLFIFVHELGHFTAAQIFGYEPEMGFRSGFSPYVVYDAETREFTFSDGVIAISGVLATILLTLLFVPLFFMDNLYIRIVGATFCVIGLCAIIAPLLPIPGTDGYKILYYKLGW